MIYGTLQKLHAVANDPNLIEKVKGIHKSVGSQFS